jgi:hypothetical protein
MSVNLDEGNLKDGLLGLVVALVEVIQELLERQALRRMESGHLSDSEIERLGEALSELTEALDKIKSDNHIDGAVELVRGELDLAAEDLINRFLNPASWQEESQREES